MKKYFEVDGYKFDDEIINIITALEFSTSLSGLENGFDLCQNINSKIIYPRNICKGTECQILRKRICDTGHILVGGFHTHPDGSKASFADIMNAFAEGMCIVSGKELLFYIRKVKANKESYDLIYNAYIKYKNYEKKYGKLSKNLMSEKMHFKSIILKEAFNIINVKIV